MRPVRASLPFHPLLGLPLLLATLAAQAPTPAVLPASTLPVREVTVFKDGHAYVVRETALPADGSGKVVLDELPAPVLGTFWPYASDGARLVMAKSGLVTVATDAAAMNFREIARANVGKDVVVVTADKERIDGKLLGVPSRQTVPAASDGELLLLQTAAGTRVLPLAAVRDLEVRGGFVGTIRGEEQKARLELTVQGGGAAAKVGVMYVQRGLRWIPAYRLDLDGKGNAAVQFEATLQNDLVDLDGATVNLVVGVPKFEFEGLVDPISLQREAAEVAREMQSQQLFFNNFNNALGNSIQTQVAGYRPAEPAAAEPEVDGATANEDLFVYTLRNVTCKKGERLVLPIAQFALGYRDVYRLDVPFAPPMEVRQNLQSERVIELARQLAAPKARHVLRLQNGVEAPLTTAPALVLSQGQVLAQGRIGYTPKGGSSDLEINVAVDIRVDSTERETKRDAGAIRIRDESYGRVELAGSIVLKNGKPVPIEVEVTRRVLGLHDAVGQGGSQQQLDLVQAWQGGSGNAWWGWWSWPYWWFQHNGFAEFRWTVQLAAGASTELTASWHYFWR
jgi:hypothetical protein